MGPTPTPTLVLLHGTRMNAGFWRDYPALLPGVRVVTPDLPGHGSRGAEDFTWEGALATVEQALPADGPVVLAGHSLGGYVAMSYAAAQPHRLAGLGLVGGERQLARQPDRLHGEVDAAGPLGEGPLERLGAVGGQQEDHVGVRVEAVHRVEHREEQR